MNPVLRFLRGEPALAYMAVLYTAVALVVAFAHLTSVQNGYLMAIAGGVGTILIAFLARPINVALVTGALGTVLSSVVVFNVHFSRAEIGSVVAAVGLVLGLVLRVHLTPTPAVSAPRNS